MTAFSAAIALATPAVMRPLARSMDHVSGSGSAHAGRLAYTVDPPALPTIPCGSPRRSLLAPFAHTILLAGRLPNIPGVGVPGVRIARAGEAVHPISAPRTRTGNLLHTSSCPQARQRQETFVTDCNSDPAVPANRRAI